MCVKTLLHLLFVAVAVVALAACDRWDGLTLRNDAETTLRVTWQLPGGREYPVYPYSSTQDGRVGTPVAPGATAEAGAVGGPPDPQPDLIVKAYDSSGNLVYCRRFSPAEYRGMTSKSPLGLKPGELRCQ
jgi:hypothetical protein